MTGLPSKPHGKVYRPLCTSGLDGKFIVSLAHKKMLNVFFFKKNKTKNKKHSQPLGLRAKSYCRMGTVTLTDNKMINNDEVPAATKLLVLPWNHAVHSQTGLEHPATSAEQMHNPTFPGNWSSSIYRYGNAL